MGPLNPISPSGSGLDSLLGHLGKLNIKKPSTKATGNFFNDLEKIAVWNKSATVPGSDARVWRKDACGAYIKWSDYGNTNSKWGWEIDHILPVAHGGTDAVSNLQVLHWRNNRSKGDNLGTNYCVISYTGVVG
jgi:hypothetical protein